MAWKKGQSGNPTGGPRDKEFATALRMVVSENGPNGVRNLRRVAQKLLECALAGEGWAIQQIADRLDGKPMQMVGGDAESPLQLISRIEHVIVDPKHPDSEGVRPAS